MLPVVDFRANPLLNGITKFALERSPYAVNDTDFNGVEAFPMVP